MMNEHRANWITHINACTAEMDYKFLQGHRTLS